MPVDISSTYRLLLKSMVKVYNLYNIEASFRNYLLSGNNELRNISIKNYLSDLRHFLGWAQINKDFEVDTTENFSQRLTSDLIIAYEAYLMSKEIPIRTIKRRLSTIRKFCKYCIKEGFLLDNPVIRIENHTDVKNEGYSLGSVSKPIENSDTSLKHIIFFFIAFWFSFILGLWTYTIYKLEKSNTYSERINFRNGIN